jgi:hypothetical protein
VLRAIAAPEISSRPDDIRLPSTLSVWAVMRGFFLSMVESLHRVDTECQGRQAIDLRLARRGLIHWLTHNPVPSAAARPAAADDQQQLDLNSRADRNQADLTGLRNQLLALARTRASESNKRVSDVVAWASSGAFQYRDIGRLTSADTEALTSAINKLQNSAVQ